MGDILDAALGYARQGIPVFPVEPSVKKKPLCGHGFKDATTDEAQIRAWWKRNPKAMIGMPTGPRTGRWVLDPDVDASKNKNGLAELAKLTAQYGPLPATLSCSTPRGGTHFHFKWNGADIHNSDSRIAPSLDVRGDGGYVVLPPSARLDGALYQWCQGVTDLADAPDWLIDLALKASKKSAKANGAGKTKGGGGGSGPWSAWALKALADECARIAAAAVGQRNSTLNAAAFNLFQIVAGGGLDEQEVRDRLFAAAEACGLVADDGTDAVLKTIASAYSAGIAQPRQRPQSGSGAPPRNPPHGPHAAAHGAPGPQPQLPIIRLTEGELPRIVNEAESALLAAGGRFHLYQRGNLIVRPIKQKLKAANDRNTTYWQLVQVTKPHLIETFTRVACFKKFDKRVDDFVRKDCPDKVAEVYLARAGYWRLPRLLGIVNIPFLRADGSLCERPGYDADSALLFDPERQTFPTIANAPNREDARRALTYLDDTLLAEFPFVQKIDRAVALSAFLTTFDRRMLATAPLHAFTSPAAGTGKSLLVDLVSILISGELAPVIAQGKTEEELEKRLGAALISGDPIISLDNCDHELNSAFLCQALTQRRLKVRLLGYSRHVDVPVNASFFATGNNLVIASDLTRRTLLCQLDAGLERPELRTFRRNVLETAYAERGPLVAAILTILRAWHLARTAIGVDPLGSFEDWSARIRQPLLWLDQDDPCDSLKTVRENDPARDQLRAVLLQWERVLGTIQTYTAQQVIGHATTDPDLFPALMAVAASRTGHVISNERLGRWLNRNIGKIVNKLKLIKTGNRAGYPLWQVTRI